MKTQFQLSILFCLLALGLHAQTPFSPAYALPDEPATTVEFQETEIDFGMVQYGDVVTRVFTFTNTGDIPLTILSARGSCGCTVPQWPKDPVLPGETASITVAFNTMGKMGRQVKKVTITANTNPQQSFLYLKGEVEMDDGLSSEKREFEKEDPVIQPECFVIAPNPTAEILKLEMEESQIGKSATVSILSVSGQLMAQRSTSEVPETIEFEVSHYPAGIYIAKVQMEKGTASSKCFVVTH